MTPKLTLTYFDGPGRAEAIRLAFTLGKIPFEDKRISFSEWPAVKPTTPNGYLPTLHVDGKQYCESIAILMYACNLAKLVPNDDITRLRNSMIVHALLDIWPSIGAIVFASDADKPALIKKASEESIPKVFANVERMIKDGQHASGLTCGPNVVAADLSTFSFVEACLANRLGINVSDLAQRFPAMTKVHKTVADMPAVKAFMGK